MACHIVLREAKGRHVSLSSFLQRRLRVHPSRSLARNYKSRLSIKSTPIPIPIQSLLLCAVGYDLPRHCFNPVSPSLFFPIPSFALLSSFARLVQILVATWSPRFVTYFLLEKYSNLFLLHSSFRACLLNFFLLVTGYIECTLFSSGMCDFSWVIRSTNPLSQRVHPLFISWEFNSLVQFFLLFLSVLFLYRAAFSISFFICFYFLG